MKEKGQGLVEYIIIVLLAIWVFFTILRLPECGWDIRALMLWVSCGG